MPVGHQRINAREPDPNPNITFIRALEGLPDSEQALKILKAIAAQFKPIMKEWGFGVNSLVEHEWNPTFAGRNWNAGEVIELVLRRKDGSFAPYQFLLYVMAHELSHCKEMNHSVFFRRVNQQLRSALASLRAQGYTGDGFWSTGRVLHPAYANAEIPLSAADEPIYTCGGANKKRGQWKRRRSAATPGPSKARGSAVKLGTTGRQTAIPAKAGGRVKRKGAFEGEGNVLSEDPEMSTKGRRAQAKNAVSARAAAAEARLAAEQRAKAAEARARGANVSPDDDKKKVKRELDIDWDADGGDLGGWETDEEDKPNVKLEEEEKEWLLEDMREFRESQAGRNGNGSGSGSAKGKGKEKEKEPVGKKRRQPSSSPSPSTSSSRQPDKSASSPSASSSKKRFQPRPASPSPLAGLDDDLTPEERAWLMADLGGGGGGVKQEESDDEVEIIEAGPGRGKKPRVAYMAMPATLGGEGGKKGKRKASSDSDDDLTSPSSILLSPPKSKSSSKAATSSSSSTKAKKSSPLVKKDKTKSPHVHFEMDEDDDDEEESEDAKPRRRSSTTSPSKKRGPMKFFSDGSDAFKYAKPTKSVSPSSKHCPRAFHPPSDPDDDDEDDASRPSSSKAKSKTKVGDPPPAKKPRKERSDKGKKRGPRPVKEDDYGAGGSSEGTATSSSPSRSGGEKKKKGGRPVKEPKTFTERYKAELAAKRRANNKELLAEIEEDERREKEEKGKRMDEDEEDQLDWTSDDESTVKKVKAAAEKALRVKQEKQDVKGKGKARAVDDSKGLVMVGLELRAGGPTTANGGASGGEPIKPFSTRPKTPKTPSFSPSASKTKAKPRPASLSLAKPLPPTSTSALDSPSSDSSIASPLTPPPDFDNFLDLSSPSQDALIAKLEADDAHNQRLKARRSAAAAAAKEEEEAAEKALLEAEKRTKKRIARRAQEIEKEAATRGETKESPRGRAGGWGRNIFAEGKATEEAIMAGAVDPVARVQLEGLFGVALGGGAMPAACLMREDAGVPPAGMEGKKWRCGMCDFDNVADLPDCEMCGLGGRSNAAKWSDVVGSA